MLQEGVDFVTLKTIHKNNPIQVWYKNNNSLTLQGHSKIIDNLPVSWADLIEQHKEIRDVYNSIAEWNNNAPLKAHQKSFALETHIKSKDGIQIVYNNECFPNTFALHK